MKKWIISDLDKNKVRELSKKYGLPVFSSMLLTIRGITEREDIERFFSNECDLSDSFLIKDMDKAVNRIKDAVVSYEKICVYGDYDCDGVTSTAILYSFLESMGANVIYYIPNRNDEGYGMNMEAVKKLNDKKVKLIITVDNGIAAIDEINYANQLGIDVVVTDHHKPLDILPNAVAVVNPHRADDNSPFKDFSGAGIALKLLIALEGNSFSVVENYTDLAALGTVADLVPINGENRDIIKSGLINIQNTERVGLAALCESSGTENITAGTIGFRLGPRINAAGRLGSAYDALRLMLTEDDFEAKKGAELLSKLNAQRQDIELQIYNEIIELIKNRPTLASDRVMVISSKDWNAGVVGIVSSRITEKYGKPSIIISEDGDVCKASGRSIGGFSLVDAVFACSDLLVKYGGHPMAVGFSIKKENIDKFRVAINDYAEKEEHMPLASIRLDCNLNPNTIVIDMVHQLESFEPFGYGNPKPVFGLTGMRLDHITPLSGGKHIKLAVSRDKARLSLLKFNTSAQEFPYSVGDVLDFAVNIESNTFHGVESLSFNVRDTKLNGFDNEKTMYGVQDYELYKSGRRSKFRGKHEAYYPERNEFALLYVFLKKRPETIYSIDSLVYRLNGRINTFKLLIMLDIMKELYLIDYERDADRLEIKIRDVVGKVDLKSSKIYRGLREDIGKNV